MEFEWDETKRQATIEERGVDILWAALIFDGAVLTREDDRKDYGEKRFISLGLVENVPYIVIYTERNGKMRLITAWKGGRKEYEQYKNSFP